MPKATTEDEEALVLAWKAERLVSLGVPFERAVELLVESTLDWHELEGLLRRGCPLETALRILR